MTGRLLYFYVLGDVLGSGIYVLIGLVAGAVALVIISAVKLDKQDRTDRAFRAPRVLLAIGVVANFLILGYVIYDDPGSLLYCAALLAVGVVLFIVERLVGGGRPTTNLET